MVVVLFNSLIIIVESFTSGVGFEGNVPVLVASIILLYACRSVKYGMPYVVCNCLSFAQAMF